jgi:hypothetical protein
MPKRCCAGRGAFCAKSLAVVTKIRTVSSFVAPYRASPCTGIPYRLTVTLKVPTFPLVSKERSEMVCSPGANWPKSTE